VRRVDGSQELARARLADGAVRPVTATAERMEAWPQWSDAASRVAFEAAAPEAGARADLVLWDPESGRESPVAATHARDERWPAWAPGAAALAFAFRGGEPASGVALLDVATGAASLAAAGGEQDFYLRPAFAPDGRVLVAQRRGPDGRGSHLWLLASGAPPRALTSEPASFDWKPGFTRAGDRIVFSRRPIAGGPAFAARIDAAGGEVQAIPLALAPGADVHSARPSPTRDELAFVAERDGRAEVFLADLSGAGVRALTRGSERQAFAPRWSPDGELLVVTATPPGAPTPRLADPEGLEQASVVVLDRAGRVLFETPGMMADWMPPWR